MASRVCWIWGLLHRTILKEWKAMDAFGKYWLWFLLQRVVAWSGHSSESQKSIFQRQTQPLLMVYFLLLTYLAFQCVLVILPDFVQPWHLLTVNRLSTSMWADVKAEQHLGEWPGRIEMLPLQPVPERLTMSQYRLYTGIFQKRIHVYLWLTLLYQCIYLSMSESIS